MSTDPEQESARDEQYVRYLLGELSEEEQSRLEEQYFADPASSERLVAAKEGLIDDYVTGRLAGRRLERFERHFLASPERRRRVETAKAVRAHARSMAGAARREETAKVAATAGRDAATRRKPLSVWWGARPAALRYSLAVALVAALLFGVCLVMLPRGERQGEAPGELVGGQADKQPPAAPPAPGDEKKPPQGAETGGRAGGETDTSSTAANSEQQASDLPRRVAGGPGATPTSPHAVAALTLTPVHTRGAGRPNTLVIPAGAARVSLQLLFGESRHGRYEALVQTVEGAEVGSARGLKPRKTARGQSVRLSLPAALFTKKDYIITLSGLPAEGGPKKVNEYFLQVRRGEPHAQPAPPPKP